MRKLIGLMVVICALMAGCGAKETKSGQPVQEGDYTTAPGGAGKSR